MSGTLVEYHAGCHCGAITARYLTRLDLEAWSVRACQCSFCRAHGALSISDPAGDLVFDIKTESALQRYRFGTGTTEFLLCRDCGVYVGAQLVTGDFGILNALALQPIPRLPAPLAMDYGAEVASSRTARRVQRWTPIRKPPAS
jgi:hypothetical protein